MLSKQTKEERYLRNTSRKHSPQERLEAEESGRYKEFHERMIRGAEALKAQEAPADEAPLPVVVSGEDAKYYRPEAKRTEWGALIRERRGGLKLVEMSCMVCGSRYLTAKSRPRKTCSDECKKEMRRRQAAIMNERKSKR